MNRIEMRLHKVIQISHEGLTVGVFLNWTHRIQCPVRLIQDGDRTSQLRGWDLWLGARSTSFLFFWYCPWCFITFYVWRRPSGNIMLFNPGWIAQAQLLLLLFRTPQPSVRDLNKLTSHWDIWGGLMGCAQATMGWCSPEHAFLHTSSMTWEG